MTRKDYVAIAAAIAAVRRTAGENFSKVDAVAWALCDVLAADNPRFDRGRFLNACREERPQ